MSKNKPTNPFYVVLVVVGIAFCLTAACYMILMFRSQHPGMTPAEAAGSGRGLLAFIDQYGNWIFLGELAVLAVATVGAITTDQYWMRRGIARQSSAETSANTGGTDETSEKNA
jgi:hypothetical protein